MLPAQYSNFSAWRQAYTPKSYIPEQIQCPNQQANFPKLFNQHKPEQLPMVYQIQ
jgi:hypothetical protein